MQASVNSRFDILAGFSQRRVFPRVHADNWVAHAASRKMSDLVQKRLTKLPKHL